MAEPTKGLGIGSIIPRLRQGIDTMMDAGIDRLNGSRAGNDSMPSADMSDPEGEGADTLVARQQKVLQAIAEPPLIFGTVLERPTPGETMSRVTVALQEGRHVVVPIAQDLVVSPGEWVSLSSKTFHVVERVGSIPCGPVARVKSRSKGRAEVDVNGASRTVLTGAYDGLCTEGDRVVLDPASAIIVCNLGNSAEKYAFTQATNVSWDDICGVDEAKSALREMIELPYQNRDVFEWYGRGDSHARGALLLGPSGCGKTLCIKAAATSIVEIHGGKGKDTAFISIKGPEILSRFVGDIEAVIRAIFALARQHYKTHGYPAIIAIDEAESILKRRGTGRSSDVETTVVPMFLVEMDGLEESGAIVILATNRPDIIDPAILRDKRLDRKIEVNRPTKESAALILRKKFAGIPVASSTTLEQLVALGVDEVFNDKWRFSALKPRCIPGTQRSEDVMFLTLAHLVNGAMVDGIADKAIMRAIRRDIETHAKSGVSGEDICAAVEMVFRENGHVNHDEEIQQIAEKKYPGLSVEVLPPEQFQTR